MNNSIIFISNTSSICFGNRSLCSEYGAEAGLNVGNRVIPIINLMYPYGHNLLILEDDFDQILYDYFTEDLQLSLPHILVHNTPICSALYPEKPIREPILDAIKAHNAPFIDAFILDAAIHNTAHICNKYVHGTSHSMVQANDKLWLNTILLQNGLPTFDAYTAYDSADISVYINKLGRRGYSHICLKTPQCFGRYGILKLAISALPKEYPDLFNSFPILIQGWIDDTIDNTQVIGSPAVQMRVDDTGPHILGITEQILKSSSDTLNIGYAGCFSPLEYSTKQILDELYEQAYIIAHILHDNGYRGLVGIDFVVTQHDNTFEIRACDINARMTASMVPLFLAHNFASAEPWTSLLINFADPCVTTHHFLAFMREHGLLYTPEKKSGCLPFHVNQKRDGTLSSARLLFIGHTPYSARNIINKLQNHIFS